MYGESSADFEPQFVDVQQQTNSTDCAALFLMHLESVSRDREPVLEVNINDLRLSQVYSLENNRLGAWEVYQSPRKNQQNVSEKAPVDLKKKHSATKNLFEK